VNAHALAPNPGRMRRGRTHQTPDLFSTALSGQTFARAKEQVLAAREQRHVLPKDFASAVKHLTDGELDLLIAACLKEAKRRGRFPASDEIVRRSSRDKSTHPAKAELATVSLTRGQISAVRAAFKAGIKPAVIARQFRISQSDVRKALASDPVSGTR
jgi:hypothetical protein